MKAHSLIITDEAQEDLIDIWLYIAGDSPQAADDFIDLLHKKCSSLCDSPEIGRERNELIPGLRSLPVKKYIVFYRIKSATLEIVRVLSGYRDIAGMF